MKRFVIRTKSDESLYIQLVDEVDKHRRWWIWINFLNSHENVNIVTPTHELVEWYCSRCVDDQFCLQHVGHCKLYIDYNFLLDNKIKNFLLRNKLLDDQNWWCGQFSCLPNIKLFWLFNYETQFHYRKSTAYKIFDRFGKCSLWVYYILLNMIMQQPNFKRYQKTF